MCELTQSGQDDVRRPPLADRPEDQRQERVGADGGHAGLAQVGAGLIGEAKQLLQLLHCLQREAPLSNLDQAEEEKGPKSQSWKKIKNPNPEGKSQPEVKFLLTLTCTAAEPPHTHSSKASRTQTALIFRGYRCFLSPLAFCSACADSASYKLLGFRLVSDLLTQAASVEAAHANTGLDTGSTDRILFFFFFYFITTSNKHLFYD